MQVNEYKSKKKNESPHENFGLTEEGGRSECDYG